MPQEDKNNTLNTQPARTGNMVASNGKVYNIIDLLLSGGAGAAIWGLITGTLADQTDLKEALDAKQDALTAGLGIDITSGTIKVEDPVMVNEATRSSSLTLGGTPTGEDNAVNIGSGSRTAEGGTAIGEGAYADGENGTAIGKDAEAGDVNATALGYKAVASDENAIQIGQGTNSKANSLFIGFGNDQSDNPVNYELLNNTGKIPSARIDGASGSFTTADNKTVTVVNGLITSIVEAESNDNT